MTRTQARRGRGRSKEEKKTCWTKEAEKMGKNKECFKVCLEQKLGDFLPYLIIPQSCLFIRSRPREILNKSFWFFLKFFFKKGLSTEQNLSLSMISVNSTHACKQGVKKGRSPAETRVGRSVGVSRKIPMDSSRPSHAQKECFSSLSGWEGNGGEISQLV